jgi:hypothetical protein
MTGLAEGEFMHKGIGQLRAAAEPIAAMALAVVLGAVISVRGMVAAEVVTGWRPASVTTVDHVLENQRSPLCVAGWC